jgi:superfamily II DNA or RNA helicase
MNEADTNDYAAFLDRKTQAGCDHGFKPVWMPGQLFPFQQSLVEWACVKGRAAIFADCGLGKTFMQLAWAENVARKTGGRVLILTPLAVAFQTVKEGEKIGVEVAHRREGLQAGDRIVVTNYERLHYFNAADFQGVVCDESSILKHYTGKTQKNVTRFLAKMPYRLLCTATAAPNDYVELGTSSEALGELSNSDMLTRFFRYRDDKGQKQDQRLQDVAEKHEQYFGKLSFRVAQTIGQWRLKNHAVKPFWRWVCSWARVCRLPSDLGYDDAGFLLPDLTERQHVIIPDTAPDGYLFSLPAFGLGEEREERRRTLDQRCDFVADLVSHNKPAVIWCHMNEEGKRLAKMITGAREIAGCTPDDEKEEIYRDFAEGRLLKLVIKPKIGAWGLNWQHCSHVVTFASHSYEQYYQSIRRCWRFGQKQPVTVDVVATEGERRVIENMSRKSEQAKRMFTMLVNEMNRAEKIIKANDYTKKVEVASWL